MDFRNKEPSSSANQNPESRQVNSKMDVTKHAKDKDKDEEKSIREGIILDSTENSTIDLTRGLCSAISSSFQSTSSTFIWKESLESVISESSRHYHDGAYNSHDFTARMLHYLNPQRFQSSVKTLPFHQWEKVGSILDVAFERYIYART